MYAGVIPPLIGSYILMWARSKQSFAKQESRRLRNKTKKTFVEDSAPSGVEIVSGSDSEPMSSDHYEKPSRDAFVGSFGAHVMNRSPVQLVDQK